MRGRKGSGGRCQSKQTIIELQDLNAPLCRLQQLSLKKLALRMDENKIGAVYR